MAEPTKMANGLDRGEEGEQEGRHVQEQGHPLYQLLQPHDLGGVRGVPGATGRSVASLRCPALITEWVGP